MMQYQTPLSKAKGYGSAKKGVHHWWMQRLTALFLLPLMCWFIYSIVFYVLQDGGVVTMLASPLHASALIVFFVVAFYHGSLGMGVVIEDYVHGLWKKKLCFVIVYFISLIACIAAVLAIVFAHLGGDGHFNDRNHPNSVISKRD